MREVLAGFALLGQTLQRLERIVLILVFVATLVLVMARMVIEQFDGVSPEWLGVALQVAFLWLVMIASVIAAGQNAHPRIRAIVERLPATATLLISALAMAAAGGACLLLMFHSLMAIAMERSFDEPAFAGLRVWQLQMIVPVALVLMAARYLARASAPVVAALLDSKARDRQGGAQ